VPKKVEREPYTGPVVQIPQDQAPGVPLSPVQYSKKDRDEKVSRVGHRDLHSSGFSLGGKLVVVEAHACHIDNEN
jgi:hypothetical protein